MTDLIGREHAELDDPLGQLTTVLTLWQDARARGWDVEADPSGYWQAKGPNLLTGMSYDPPGPVSTGVVGAFDEHRTLALTGIDARQAVAALRGFFDWPATGGAVGCPCGSPATDSDAAGDCCDGYSASGGDR